MELLQNVQDVVGWLDLVALKYSCRINGLTGLAINHLDTIGKLDKIKLCVAYNHNGKVSRGLFYKSYLYF